MLKYKILILTLIGSCLLSLAPYATVSALANPEFGGNNSSDYQPPTSNPQGDTLTGLQPNNNSGLQPSPTNINPQNLMQSGGLKVSASPVKGANSTVSQPISHPKPKSVWPARIIGVIVVLFAAVMYWPRKPGAQTNESEPVTVEPPVIDVQPKKTKQIAKKSTRKQRKKARR